MSLTKEKRHFKNEMPSGVHLASIFDIKLYKDSVTKQPIVKDDEMGLIVTFWTTNAEKQNLYHEQVYWCGKGNAGREKYFTQMCLDAMIDMSVTPMDVKQAKNKRLWIAIREVYTLINNGEEVKKDMLGNDVIEKFIFQTAPIFDVDRVPTWKGDPKFNDGIACDEFVGYKEDSAEDGYVTMPTQGEATPFVLEVAHVTPEVEQAVVVVKEAAKPKKEKKVKEVLDKAFEEQIMFGVSGVKVEDGKLSNVPIEKVHELLNKSTTPMPNFGESATPTIAPSFDNEIVLSEEEITDIQNTEDMLHQGRQEASDMNEVLMQDNVDQTPLPNFGDNETPDTNF